MPQTVESVIDDRRFRSVLGLYPTGVTAITARNSTGDPIGMVVGTFSSVSLEPPLISFMPARSSSSWARLSEAQSFCVNVLAGDQETVCRTFAVKGSQEKFATVTIRDSPRGNPILDGCVAWIECETWQVVEAGDHDIVIGKVTALGEGSDTLPLLFLGGGYGRFSPHSRVMPATADIMQQLRLADSARISLERCAAELDLECGLVAPVEDSVVRIASADSPTNERSRPALVGLRLPLAAPVGSLLVAWADEAIQRKWVLRGEPGASDEVIDNYLGALTNVRREGWTLTPGDAGFGSIDAALNSGDSVAIEVNALTRQLAGTATFDPGQISGEREHAVHSIAAPIFDSTGAVVMYITAFGFPSQMTGNRILGIASQLQESAAHIGERLSTA